MSRVPIWGEHRFFSGFTRDGDTYVSAEYATVTNKVELYVETGVGSVDVN